MSFSTLCACTITLAGGLVHNPIPPNGIWWQSAYPASFHNNSLSAGVGLRGRQWSVEAAYLGTMNSAAEACANDDITHCTVGGMPTSHWYGHERPFGAWAAWEPHYGHWFLQLGVGAVNPNFTMEVPDWRANDTAAPRSIVHSNHSWYPSWIAGAGVALSPHMDLILSGRRIKATGAPDTATEAVTLSSMAYSLSLRYSF